MTITRDTRLTRAADVLYAQLGSEGSVMLSVEQGCYYGLNPVAARICELLETTRTVAEISAQVCAEFEVDRETADAAVLEFVTTLAANGIVHAGT
jgi:hypothetical protein